GGNNTQHQPGEAVVRILNIGLKRWWNNTRVTYGTTTLLWECGNASVVKLGIGGV
ncbi:hypothetical protein A2U01_0066263, partial [Trifolium medium]|nr:hypothetical protein [Trifolium medium]